MTKEDDDFLAGAPTTGNTSVKTAKKASKKKSVKKAAAPAKAVKAEKMAKPAKKAARVSWGKGKFFMPKYSKECTDLQAKIVREVKEPVVGKQYADDKGIPMWKVRIAAQQAAKLGTLKVGSTNGTKRGLLMIFPKAYRGKLDYSALG